MSLSYRQAVNVLFVAFAQPGPTTDDWPDPTNNFALVPSNFGLEDDKWTDNDWSVVEEVLEGFFDEDLPFKWELAKGEGPKKLAELKSANIALYVDTSQGDHYYYLATPGDAPN
ncbi:MAG TPA: hypothetical protein VLF41_00055 [Candidatus Nanoarchaeia archaeon]|nr:hypothetical protein [Candidatus Nanoarchaeia archaeon]